MSNLQMLTNNAFGVRKYLEKKGFDVGGKGKKPNDILIIFLKENNLKYEKWNPRYKGFFTAELSNAVVVSENWEAFKIWVSNNKPIKI